MSRMRNLLTVTCCGILLSACVPFASKQRRQPAVPAATEDGITVYFSPKGGCTLAIVEQIAKTITSIDMQAYSFTSTDIAKALTEAQDRGVTVRAVLDKQATGQQFSGGTYLADHHVAVWTDGLHPIVHNKVIIIDGNIVITGSFNFTRQADRGGRPCWEPLLPALHKGSGRSAAG